MKFTKMYGIDDDYLYFSCFEEPVTDPAALSIRLGDRHFGVGSDGIILIGPGDKTDCSMDTYDADGSRAMTCGNGIYYVSKYACERDIAKKKTLTVDTQSGVKTLFLTVDENDRVASVTVNMDRLELSAPKVPTLLETRQVIDHPVEIVGREYRVTYVSVDSPHYVVFMDDVDTIPLSSIGPSFEFRHMFPQRVDTEFVQIIGGNEVKMRVWEHGSDETWARGTGACAMAVAYTLGDKTGRQVLVHLGGGGLNIRWDEETDEVFMQGPAGFVFDRQIDWDCPCDRSIK